MEKKWFIYNSSKQVPSHPSNYPKQSSFKKMSHRKVYSQGRIPFSWEDKPGISKVITNQDQEYCLLKHNSSLQALDLIKLRPPQPPPDLLSADYEAIKIPLPPCQKSQPPRRSTSSKDDPFLVAYKECTKTTTVNNANLFHHDHHDGVNKRGSGVVGSKLRKTKFLFSCKSSCDTREDNFIKLSNLPPLPRRHKIPSLW